MDPEKVVSVEDGAYFVAVGSALSDEAKELEFKDRTANLDKAEAGHGIARDERLAREGAECGMSAALGVPAQSYFGQGCVPGDPAHV